MCTRQGVCADRISCMQGVLDARGKCMAYVETISRTQKPNGVCTSHTAYVRKQVAHVNMLGVCEARKYVKSSEARMCEVLAGHPYVACVGRMLREKLIVSRHPGIEDMT